MVGVSVSNTGSDATKVSRKDRRMIKASGRRGQSLTSGSVSGGLRVGVEVVLVGMKSEKLNGSAGKIASMCDDGRWRVRLRAHGKKRIAVAAENLEVA